MSSKKAVKTITDTKAREIVKRIQNECVSDLKVVSVLKTPEGKYTGIKCKLADETQVIIRSLTDLKPYNVMRCGRNAFSDRMGEQLTRMLKNTI